MLKLLLKQLDEEKIDVLEILMQKNILASPLLHKLLQRADPP